MSVVELEQYVYERNNSDGVKSIIDSLGPPWTALVVSRFGKLDNRIMQIMLGICTKKNGAEILPVPISYQTIEQILGFVYEYPEGIFERFLQQRGIREGLGSKWKITSSGSGIGLTKSRESRAYVVEDFLVADLQVTNGILGVGKMKISRVIQGMGTGLRTDILPISKLEAGLEFRLFTGGVEKVEAKILRSGVTLSRGTRGKERELIETLIGKLFGNKEITPNGFFRILMDSKYLEEVLRFVE